jgi:hypothetical protein
MLTRQALIQVVEVYFGQLNFDYACFDADRSTQAVLRKILRQPNFTWAEHGEALLRRRKPWYHEPRPDIAVIGARLSELIGR